jgi:hypothetical protein
MFTFSPSDSLPRPSFYSACDAFCVLLPNTHITRRRCVLLCVHLLQIGKRGEEARDMARYALRNPWWSLAHFDATRAVSELQGDAQQVHWQLSAEATEASTSQVTGFQYKEPRTEQEVGALPRHDTLLLVSQ